MRVGSVLITVLALTASASVAAADAATVSGIRLSGDRNAAEVVVNGEFGVPTYSVRGTDGGSSVVLEMTGASLEGGRVRVEGSTPLIERSVASATGAGVRVEVTAREPVTYHARAEDGRVTVRLVPLAAAEDAPAEPAAAGPLRVERVHVERRDGRERVIVELSEPAPFRVVPGSVGPARLEIENAGIAQALSRGVASDGLRLVRGVSVRPGTGRAVVEVERSDGAVGTAIREGRRIVWMFSQSSETQANARPQSRTLSREAPIELDGEYIVTAGEAAAFLSDVPLQVDGARGQRRYAGRRIDLDFKDADIHNILRLLAEVGGVNVVTADDVSGQVTIRMRNVPWDQALDVILQAKGLGLVRRGNLIRVAPLATLEKERELAIARRKQEVDLAPIETRIIPVSYATADGLQARVREQLSSRGSVSTDERTNVLIVRDVIENLDNAEELVRSLDTQTPQVLVEARIVEATSSYNRDVGIQWGGDLAMTTLTGNPTGLSWPGNFTLAGGATDADAPTTGLSPFVSGANPNYAVNFPAPAGTGAGGAIGLSLGSISGNVNLSVRLSAAESQGSVRIVSSPRILTLDNTEATISQGTMIPYSQVSAQGVQTAFQEARLELKVTPHVTADGSVAMEVVVTRNEPDFSRTGARGDPTILKREAKTSLLVPDGHTAVIGGIYTRNVGRNLDQVPFFGDIPIIGILFQHRRVRDDRNELLIFLTPRIVNRVAALAR